MRLVSGALLCGLVIIANTFAVGAGFALPVSALPLYFLLPAEVVLLVLAARSVGLGRVALCLVPLVAAIGGSYHIGLFAFKFRLSRCLATYEPIAQKALAQPGRRYPLPQQPWPWISGRVARAVVDGGLLVVDVDLKIGRRVRLTYAPSGISAQSDRKSACVEALDGLWYLTC